MQEDQCHPPIPMMQCHAWPVKKDSKCKGMMSDIQIMLAGRDIIYWMHA
jgi:hypothetical protein